MVDHIRLFRNHPKIRWKYRIHEQILPSIRQLKGQVEWSDVVIQHVGYLDKAVRLRKRQRDLRLLTIEHEENPNDPFTLFNLGAVHQEQGNVHKALVVLQRSLELSHPSDSIFRKLYTMIAQCLRHLGQHRQALATSQAGRKHYPDDIELQFQEGLAWKSLGEKDAAIRCFERLLNTPESDYFASVDTGLRGYKARHNLAVLYQEQGRAAEAEAQWREALKEQPDFVPALIGLGELWIAQQRWQDVTAALAKLEQYPQANLDRVVLHARMLLVQRNFAEARRLLEAALEQYPDAVYPWIVLSHVLLQEGNDLQAAERALRQILRLIPDHAEAKRNLAVLLQRQQDGNKFAHNNNNCAGLLASLERCERKVYSQNGEDGILEAVFAAIGTTNRYFVEFGCGDATECNTAFLIEQGWQGLLMDPEGISRNPKAVIQKEFITAENINQLLRTYEVPQEFDLLSIDIDGNDYWVWQAISHRPRVVVIEYNASVPPGERKAIAYEPSFRWNGSDYCGASLLALKELGEQKGYTLIYCESHGVNAFFIAKEALPPSFGSLALEGIYRPPNYNGRGYGHQPDKVRRMIDPIDGL